MTQQTGTVERLTDKGFGFIKPIGERRTIFFHATSMRPDLQFKDLEPGDRVSFTRIETDKGEAAIDVDVISRPHGASAEDDGAAYDGGAAS